MEGIDQARIPNVVTIAGVDPSGGAGVLADVKAMSACGAFACGVVTALTAQNTRAVTGVLPVDLGFVREQIDTLWADVEIDAVKIGMLGTAGLVDVVADALERYRPRWVVLDPVMIAKSGDRLLEVEATERLKERMLPLANVLTPNLPEATALLGRPSDGIDLAGFEAAARELLSMMSSGDAWVLLKGGHLDSENAPDLLLGRNERHLFDAPRIMTKNTHGTGCTLSSAIAAYLPVSASVPEAVERAKAYLTEAIRHADALSVGSGHGPTDHFWALRETPSKMKM